MADVEAPRSPVPPTRSGRGALLKFLVVGGASYLIDVGLLVLLSGPLDRPVWLAATVGFWVSVVVNFTLNRLVFATPGGGGNAAVHGARYAVLLGVNYLVTLGVVHVGVSWGLAPVIPKTFVVALIMTWNFVLYRRWVFR